MKEFTCYVCGSDQSVVVLDKPAIPIWTNSADDDIVITGYKCQLNLCKECGHVYQPVDDNLSAALEQVYSSHQSALSTSMSKGNWGKVRGGRFLDMFTSKLDIKRHHSVLEIGCDDGYLLRQLQLRGVTHLDGIEPSLTEDITIDGIKMMKGFAQKGVSLGRKYNLIFASDVFEHITDINGIVEFCADHLEKGGQLYFSIPDTSGYLSPTDPALFSHQHVQYFSRASVTSLLARHGFKVLDITIDRDSQEVFAEFTGESSFATEQDNSILNYNENVDKLLGQVDDVLRQPGVVVHAANNALNNILGWLNHSYDFTLVDNDDTKHGKTFFGKTVQPLSNVDLSKIETVLIIPNAFRDQIHRDYTNLGFKGKVVDLVQLAQSKSQQPA